MFGLSSLYVKLIGGAVAALILLGLVFGLKHYRHLAETRGESLAVICQATRTASGQSTLGCGQVSAQIQFMGTAISTLTAAIHNQNDAIAAMGAETSRQQTASAQASQAAAARAGKAQATSTRLEASSRAGGAQVKPCDASEALQGAWR